MKIVFIGAGVASLATARKLAEKGFDCVIFEKNQKSELCYDWTDDVARVAFGDKSDEGVPARYFVKKPWSFVSPDEKTVFTPYQPEEMRDLSVYRRDYSYELIGKLPQSVKIYFGEGVENLIKDGDKVIGVETSERREYADLVVDGSGAMSPFRRQASDKLERKPGKSEVFYAYRGFYDYAEGADRHPEVSNRAILKHLGKSGISWCICGDEDVDVLVGRTEETSKEDYEFAIAELRKTNPEIGQNLIKCGSVSVIPIRHPLYRMVSDGYVAIGDSAFMTIPICGSGVQSCLYASKILADTLIEMPEASKENLWKYQVAYYKIRGAEHFGTDVMKRWLLEKCPVEDLNYVFGTGALNENIQLSGELVKINFAKVLPKAIKILSRPKLALRGLCMLLRSIKASKIANKIPKEYDEEKIGKWEFRLSKLFK